MTIRDRDASSILCHMQEPNSKLTLSPAPRRKLTETVAEQLLAAIRNLPPGAKVPSERELTKDLGVGRSTVREAVRLCGQPERRKRFVPQTGPARMAAQAQRAAAEAA